MCAEGLTQPEGRECRCIDPEVVDDLVLQQGARELQAEVVLPSSDMEMATTAYCSKQCIMTPGH